MLWAPDGGKKLALAGNQTPFIQSITSAHCGSMTLRQQSLLGNGENLFIFDIFYF
jgi:hypothetical protein